MTLFTKKCIQKDLLKFIPPKYPPKSYGPNRKVFVFFVPKI